MSLDAANFSVERRGRLLEARVWALDDVEVADRYSRAIAEVAGSPGAEAPILCADHRYAELYPQPVTDRLLALFEQMNTRLGRIAIVVHPEQATFFMQLNRIVREAGFDKRQVFRDVEEALRFLALDLDGTDIDHARRFLRAGPRPGGRGVARKV